MLLRTQEYILPEKRPQFAVANLGSIDDVLLTSPLLDSIRKAHPTSRITYIVARGAAQVLDYSPFINELIIWPAERSNRRSGMQMLRKMGRRRFDASVVFTPNTYLNAIFWLGRTPKRIQTRDLNSAARELGVQPPDGVQLQYTVTPTERAAALATLARWNIDPEKEKVLAIHPGSWPVESYLEVTRQAADLGNCKVVILGDSEERPLASQLATNPSAKLVDLTSRMSFREQVAVLAQTHLLLHSSSLTGHLAAAIGLRVVSTSDPNIKTAADVIAKLNG